MTEKEKSSNSSLRIFVRYKKKVSLRHPYVLLREVNKDHCKGKSKKDRPNIKK